MFVLENLIFALAKIIDIGLTIYMWIIIGRALISWVNPTQRNAHFSIDWVGEEIPEKTTEGLVRMVRDFFR